MKQNSQQSETVFPVIIHLDGSIPLLEEENQAKRRKMIKKSNVADFNTPAVNER